jgi:hypothetical protein
LDLLAIGILSYNMPELTDALVEQIKSKIKIPYKLIVFDNGSDKEKRSKYTTHFIEENTRLTGGMNNILHIARNEVDGLEGIWLCTSDICLVDKDVDYLLSMALKCKSNESIGVIHPSLIKPVENYAYPWMIKIPGNELHKGYTINHPMVDIICPFYTKKALDVIGWEFEKRFEYGWGIDWLSCYQVRKAGLKIAVDFDILISHQTSVTYDTGNDKEFKNRKEYYQKASENMNKGMVEILGQDWRKEIGAS